MTRNRMGTCRAVPGGTSVLKRMIASEAPAIRRKTRSTKVIDLRRSSPMVRR